MHGGAGASTRVSASAESKALGAASEKLLSLEGEVKRRNAQLRLSTLASSCECMLRPFMWGLQEENAFGCVVTPLPPSSSLHSVMPLKARPRHSLASSVPSSRQLP